MQHGNGDLSMTTFLRLFDRFADTAGAILLTAALPLSAVVIAGHALLA